jgi:hypothetical protein
MPHNGGPSLYTCPENSFSPQIEHKIPFRGVICSRHVPHTGRAEMFVSGRWQMRQSEGKKTENKLSAANLKVLCARLRSPLLKTDPPWNSDQEVR